MLTKMGMMVAISVVISFLHFPILPSAPFLEYEPSNIPVLVGTFVFGPLGGLVIAVLSILLHDLLAGPSSGIYGMLMHLVATGTLVLVAGLIYRGHKTRKRAVIALIAGALSVGIIMVPANLVITPLFMGVPVNAVIAMLPTAIVPFNLLSGAITCVATFLLYKLVSPFLHRW
jgi:riboflavin transporter FmnP